MHRELPVGWRLFQPRRRGGDEFRSFLKVQQALRILLICDSLHHLVRDRNGQSLGLIGIVHSVRRQSGRTLILFWEAQLQGCEYTYHRALVNYCLIYTSKCSNAMDNRGADILDSLCGATCP